MSNEIKTRLTAEKEAEIRAREAAARPGPWIWNANPCSKTISLESVAPSRWNETVLACMRWGMSGAIFVFNNQHGLLEKASAYFKNFPKRDHHANWAQTVEHPDADFIAHARQDVPALLDALDGERRRNEALKWAICYHWGREDFGAKLLEKHREGAESEGFHEAAILLREFAEPEEASA